MRDSELQAADMYLFVMRRRRRLPVAVVDATFQNSEWGRRDSQSAIAEISCTRFFKPRSAG